MKAGIVGLGLIGGSFAKAYHAAGHTVWAKELDRSVLSFAELSDAVDGELTKDNIGDCDIILICVYPQAVIDFLDEMGPYIGKKPVVIDCCGTKRVPMIEGEKIAEKYGFLYVGGHPMAGTQFSGFKYAKETLFKGAPMVIVPPVYDNIELLEKVKELLEPAGFRKITVTTAEKHDEMIAFTSQLAHVVSNAYIKSPTALAHKGFSAGSYRDMTRVAWLNPNMWAELFLDNKDYLVREIDTLIDSLSSYKKAIENDDRETLIKLLDEGKKRKEEVDG
ncbi:MAG: prephenate dehydrogenase [Lachnospiraceae bacterium]|nr:prephenate dehydrogenase [Lachnospiraceae bacterium]